RAARAAGSRAVGRCAALARFRGGGGVPRRAVPMERQWWRPPRRAAAERPEPERCAPAGSPEASAPSRPRCWPAPARAVERPTAAAALGGRARRQARGRALAARRLDLDAFHPSPPTEWTW
ncbi:unnamed protein product, partial [Prorocentrum cordatum]